MSKSVEMYLVMTALLRSDPQHPVPISLLASRLAVTPVSANERWILVFGLRMLPGDDRDAVTARLERSFEPPIVVPGAGAAPGA